MRFSIGTWPAYLLIAGMAVLMATSLSACRFGNKVVGGQEDDGYTGYYKTAPKTLDFCVSLAGGGENCAAIPQNEINNYVPNLVYEVMANPVAFALTDLATGQGILFAPTGTKALPLFLNKSDLSVSVLASNDPPPALWGHPECTHHFSLSALGKISQTSSEVVSGLKTRGTMEITFEVLDLYSGTCTTAMAEMEACYFDHTTCEGLDEPENLALQQSVRDLYLPYIASGSMTANQISDVLGFGYNAAYE